MGDGRGHLTERALGVTRDARTYIGALVTQATTNGVAPVQQFLGEGLTFSIALIPRNHDRSMT